MSLTLYLAITLIAPYRRSLREFQNQPTTEGLVDSLTDTLRVMLNKKTDMEFFNATADCRFTSKACQPENCFRPISLNPKERIWDLLSPELTLTEENRHLIEDLSSTIPVSDVIFVTATSDNHFDETQAAVHSLHTVVYPRVPNMILVIFDIGLTNGRREKTEKACKCHVVVFPFERFPKFFKERGCYTWKPLIVMASMMKARKLVVYQDASISWKDPVLELLDRGDKLGLQLWGAKIMHNIPVATLKGMFDYMGDMPCAYLNYTQIQSGIIVLKKAPFIVRAILEPWAKCGFEKDCFCPNTTINSSNCQGKYNILHWCHRFDQSALSMIVTKLFATERYRYHMKDTESEDDRFVKINRHQREGKYFDQLLANS
ncbi:hypothetical protein BgiBS90_028252 [Biomphalaria glabrata]|nr:hypothetical protein BgiBS90_028252 [Biomphalaria glabrata]